VTTTTLRAVTAVVCGANRLTDTDWTHGHRDYQCNGISDVWLRRPNGPVSWMVLGEVEPRNSCGCSTPNMRSSHYWSAHRIRDERQRPATPMCGFTIFHRAPATNSSRIRSLTPVPYQTGTDDRELASLVDVVVPSAQRAWAGFRDVNGRLKFEHDHYALTRPHSTLDDDLLCRRERVGGPVVADHRHRAVRVPEHRGADSRIRSPSTCSHLVAIPVSAAPGPYSTGLDTEVIRCRRHPCIAVSAAAQAAAWYETAEPSTAASIGGFGSAWLESTCSVMILLLGCVG
jgi:hypothetical protein